MDRRIHLFNESPVPAGDVPDHHGCQRTGDHHLHPVRLCQRDDPGAGPSWIEFRSAAGALIIHVGTLTAGEHRTYPAPVWIRTGNPAVITVTEGSSRLAVPTDRGPIDEIVVTTSPP